MKLIKKIAAIMFAFMMVFTLSSNVNAEETTGTGKITINGAISGESYTIYKVFDLESFDGDNYSYKVTNEKWKEFFKTGEGKTYVDINDYDGVTWKNEKTATQAEKENQAKELAPKMLKFAKHPTNGISGTTATADNTGHVEFNNLELGYYLVDSSVGALCGLNTTATQVTINEKNQKPTLNKYVNLLLHEPNKADKASLIKNTTKEIGDYVYFTAEIDNFKGAENLVFTDIMDSGLSLSVINNVVHPQVHLVKRTAKDTVADTDIVELKLGERQDYVTTYEKIGEKDKFTLKFTDSGYAKLEQYYNDYVLRISYYATVNKNALINNENTATLKYGNNPNVITSNAYVGVLSIPVFKSKNDNTPLPKAEFSLYTTLDDANNGVNPIEFKQDDSSKEIYRKATNEETDTVKKITTNNTGKFEFYGLKEGEYYLKEIKAPEGYNKLKEPIKVTVTKKVDNDTKMVIGHSLNYTYGKNAGNGVTEVQVINETGSLLPSTGGMGTTLIYLIGGALVLGSGIVLANKKRAKAK